MSSSSESSSPRHLIVVGAGVVGMLSALEMRRRGWRVSVFDRGQAAQESSWAGGGILSPILPWHYPQAVWTLAQASLPLYAALAPALAQSTGIDPELTPSGALVLDPDALTVGARWCADAGLTAMEMDAILRTRGPLHPGLLLPWIGQIRTPRLGRALAAQLRLDGVELHEHTAVSGWCEHHGRIVGVVTAAGESRADAVLLTAGAWSGALAPVPVQPVRGQMLAIRAAPSRLKRIVLDRGRYLIPRRDGCILVGSTVEPGSFDKHTTAEARDELLAFATGLLGDEGLADAVEAHWTGLRPGSADGVPLIGEHPALPGLWVNTGHFRNGLVMAPASAVLLADLLCGVTPAIDARPYALEPGRL